MRGLFEIHPATIAESASGMRRLLDGFSADTFGAIFDPGNMIISGRESWPMAIAILGPYLVHVHVKNVSWRRSDEDHWSWENDRLQCGTVNWREVITALQAAGYAGYLSVEDLYGVTLHTTGLIGAQLPEEAQRRVPIRRTLVEDLTFLKTCLSDASSQATIAGTSNNTG